MNRFRLYTMVLFWVSAVLLLQAQTLVPRPDPPRLVNDLAGVLSSGEVYALEKKLVAFNDSTSNQIAILIVNDLQGYDRSVFAFRVANDWGVGQGDLNNGVLVLVKPKTPSSDGQVFIAIGAGLEGAIPDLAAADIIDREIIPRFRKNDYYGGLDDGTDVLMSLAAGEYSYDRYARGGIPPVVIPIVALFLITLFITIIIRILTGSVNNRHIKRSGSSNLPYWLYMGPLDGDESHSGSWGRFSGSNGGSSGGSSSSFSSSSSFGSSGGFGGGSFRGGGAGGRW